MPIIVNNLSFTYGPGTPFEAPALKAVDLTIEDGSFVGIMGHTGCGKSTLIQLMDGLLVPTDGTILVDGQDINDPGFCKYDLRQKIGLVFQYPECQLFETTVQRDVAFGLKHLGLSKQETDERIRWALEICGFDYETIRSKAPTGLSGGEKRRVAIAGVLAVRPKYLILDEPFAGLDPVNRESFLELLVKLNREGTTVIVVSHNADCLCQAAGRILLLHQGKLLLDGTPGEVFADVERMKALQLGVGDAREIAWLLTQKGMDIPADTASYDKLLPAVIQALQRRRSL